MSDYLTNLAITLTNAEPAIRPRLGARFEPLRPRFMAQDLAPAAAEPAHADLEVVEPGAVAAAGAVLDAPPSRAPVRPTLSAEVQNDITEPQRRRTQLSTASDLLAEHALDEPSNPVQQTTFVNRINPAGAPPRQTPQSSAAVSGVAGGRPRLPVSKVMAGTAASATQSQGKSAGAPSVQAASAASISAEPVSQPSVTKPPRLTQLVQPVMPPPGLIASRKVESVTNPSQSDMLASPEPSSGEGANWHNTRAPEAKKQAVAQAPGIEPVGASRRAPSGRTPTEDARPFAGARMAPGLEGVRPTIRVTIGRVEVRVTPPSPEGALPTQRTKAAPRKPVVSLEEYLAQRNGDRR